MKRVSFIISIIFLPVLIFGWTGMGGGRGHLFVSDALTQGPGFLTFSLHSLYRITQVAPDTWKRHYNDLLLALTYSPVEFIELAGFGGGVFKYHPPTDLSRGWHDWNFKGKLVFPLLKVFKPGVSLGYNFPRDSVFDENSHRQKDGLEWLGLVNLKFSDLFPSLPNLLFNYGKYKTAQDSSYSAFGASLELQALGLLFFTEYYSTAGLQRLTPGVKFLSSSFTLDLGWSFLFLEDETRRNQLFLGFTYLTPFLRVYRPTGKIVGRVYDAGTKRPIPAKISFPENPKLKPIANDPSTGVYKAEKIPEGTILVEVTSEGYFKDYVPVTVKKDEVTTQDFFLKPLKPTGILTGRIFDANTGKPLKAKVSFPNTDLAAIFSDSLTGAFRLEEVPAGIVAIEAEREGYFKQTTTVTVKEREVTNVELSLSPSAFTSVITGKVSDQKTGNPISAEITFEGAPVLPVRTDPNTGIYRAELPIGTYAAIVKADGYITQTLPVILEKDKITEKNFSLVRVGMVIALKVLFDFNKATIKPESYRGLDEAAQILKDNPKIMVEIQGHTDNIGSDAYNKKLSERRAQAVVNYFVSQHGIDIRRLKAVGYGEEKPLASNATAEGRALNRRVEFVILGEEK